MYTMLKKWSLYLIQVALSFCSTRLTFDYLYWSWWSIHRSAVWDSSNNGLMIPWVRQILTPSLKLPYILDIITSFIFSDDASSIVCTRDNTTFFNPLCHYNHTYLRSVASTFSIYCNKFMETGINLSTYSIDMVTVQMTNTYHSR